MPIPKATDKLVLDLVILSARADPVTACVKLLEDPVDLVVKSQANTSSSSRNQNPTRVDNDLSKHFLWEKI